MIDDDLVRPRLFDAKSQAARFVIRDDGQRAAEGQTIEYFRNFVGALPYGKCTEIKTRNIHLERGFSSTGRTTAWRR